LPRVEAEQRGQVNMSLFGKIVALFNIFGAVALFFLAAMVQVKRETWTYNVLQHELVLHGMPLNEKETDRLGRPHVEQISNETRTALFAGAGEPVETQVKEVENVRARLVAKLNEQKDQQGQPLVRGQTFLLARILLPLSDSHVEREQLLACRAYLASEDTLKAFRERYQEALIAALKRPDLPFDEAFRYAVRTRGSEPSEAFTSILLDVLPGKPDSAAEKKPLATDPKAFDAIFAKALEVQRQQLQARFDGYFDHALTNVEPPQGQPGQADSEQKLAIARLLFSLCPLLADDSITDRAPFQGLDPTSPAFAQKLLDSEAYKRCLRRVYVICGLRMTLTAINDEAARLRKLAESVTTSEREEQLAFIMDNATQIEGLRERAQLVQTELARITDNQVKLTDQKELVKKRERDVKQLQDELELSRDRTAEALADLRKLSEQVREKRVELRDAILKNEEAEKKVRELEGAIRARERKSRADAEPPAIDGDDDGKARRRDRDSDGPENARPKRKRGGADPWGRGSPKRRRVVPVDPWEWERRLPPLPSCPCPPFPWW
jgi:hypothetical protein